MSEKVATNTLEQFLSTAKNDANNAQALADLIVRAVESTTVYAFSELLDLPNIEALKTHPQFGGHYELLRLFAYGTYLDYKTSKISLPTLSSNALMKLRHLSIITLSSKCRSIAYDTLCKELEINNIRELEDLIIEAFYADILKGKLDQLNNKLEVEFAIGRDVTDEQVDEILATLDNWCTNCNIALRTIETQVSNANNYKQKQTDTQASIEAEVANLKKSFKMQTQEVESLISSGTASSKDSGKKSLKLKR